MVGVTLRPYQQAAVDAVFGKFDSGEHATLIVCATGTGKTTVFGEVARRGIAERGWNVLVLAHREELISQAAGRLSAMCGVEAGIEKAGSHYGYDTPLCIASVQTLQGSRLDALRRGWFDLVVVDEAHHAVASSYRTILDNIGNYVLGVTATADRADKRGLAEVFDSIAYDYPIARAVSEGYLCPIRAKCIPLSIDLSNVKVSHGDFQANDLGDALAPYLRQVAAVMRAECAFRKTVAFLPLVSTAEQFAEVLNDAGLSAVAVSGYDPSAERAGKIAAFVRGDYDVLCNSMLVTEGFDCPEIDCVVVLRPTKSRGLYTQMVGRGTRISDGKENLLLLDFLWMTEKHDLCRPASLLGKEPEVAAKMQETLERDAGGSWDGIDIMELAEQAETDVAQQREEALAKELERLKRRKKKLVDPLQFAMSVQDLDLIDYTPTFRWESMPATEGQVKTLEKFQIDAEGITKGQASKLITSLIERSKSNLATPKQVRCLEKYGFRHVGRWAFEDASKMISRIAAMGWKEWKLRESGITPETYDPRGVPTW